MYTLDFALKINRSLVKSLPLYPRDTRDGFRLFLDMFNDGVCLVRIRQLEDARRLCPLHYHCLCQWLLYPHLAVFCYGKLDSKTHRDPTYSWSQADLLVDLYASTFMYILVRLG